MIPTERWLAEEGAPAWSRVVEGIAVPFVIAGLVGLLWSLPVPAVFREASPVINWGTLFLMAAVVYYFIISISLAFGVLPLVVLIATAVAWLDTLDVPLAAASGLVFLAAWGAQLAGRWSAGVPLRPVTHLLHVMMAPVRMLASLYRRVGIPY